MDFMDVINNTIFPIAACGAMGWYVKYITEKHHNQTMELIRAHEEESDKLVEALNNNTVALTKLAERLESEKER